MSREVRRFKRLLDIHTALLTEADFYEEALSGSEEEMDIGQSGTSFFAVRAQQVTEDKYPGEAAFVKDNTGGL